MTIRIHGKINQLSHLLPEGLLVDSSWMEKNGYSRSLRSQYVTNGWLKQPARSVYSRPRGAIRWESVVISLQTLLGYPVSVGGRTALEYLGYAHYLYQTPPPVHLYCDVKLPGWLAKLPDCPEFIVHNRSRFLPPLIVEKQPLALADERTSFSLPDSLQISEWGQWQWPLITSAPERAILEVIDELPTHESFDIVDKFMAGLVNLRPARLQKLLEDARSVKVKRLFFYFADRHNHQWLEHIDRNKIDLGKGKRLIVKNGKLDTKYFITIPENMDAI